MRTTSVLCTLLIYLFLTGCQESPTLPDAPPDSIASPLPTQPAAGDVEMTPSTTDPANPGVQGLIETARADLSERLVVPINTIVIVEMASVVWPDGSLGCPEEGMQYAQVLTPGYLIRLQSEDRIFEYHASKGSTVIYCENPSPPVEGTPGDV